MTEPKPNRAWWRKKRWWAAIFSAAVAYPLSYGPSYYAARKGWIPGGVRNAFYGSAGPVMNSAPYRRVSDVTGLDRWTMWWQAKADPDLFGEPYREHFDQRTGILPPIPEPDDGINRTRWTAPKKADP